jgi:hypothetical protein
MDDIFDNYHLLHTDGKHGEVVKYIKKFYNDLFLTYTGYSSSFEPTRLKFDKTNIVFDLQVHDFDLFNEKINKLCKCTNKNISIIINKHIFYYICNNCKVRYPHKDTGLFPVKPEFQQILINNGIINNCQINNNNIVN